MAVCVGRAANGIALALVLLAPRIAAAQTCDAGVMCPDDDRDGFATCACAGAGTPCDCDDTDPTAYPGAPERCDSTRDLNCSGAAPDRCPLGEGCLEGTCVPVCIAQDDFGCAGGSFFTKLPDSGVCLCDPNDCTVFGCPAGETCDDAKTCMPTCHPGVRCPFGQVCRGFGCVDPCRDLACPEGSTCDRGLCVREPCVDPRCAGVVCASGAHCEEGTCVDDCEGVVCPTKRVCRKASLNGAPARGACVDLCNPSPCLPGSDCDWRTGACIAQPLAEGGIGAPPELFDPLSVGGAGWLCQSEGVTRLSALSGLASAAGLALFVVRRARRKGRPRNGV